MMKKIILISILAIIVFLLVPKNQIKSLEFYERGILRKCQGKGPVCYDEELPKLMSKLSMEDTFKITSGIQQKDPSYAYCHVLGHKLSSAETKKDPSKWKDVIARCPSGTCSNGCVHGAFQERFRTESFSDSQLAEAEKELKGICEPREGFNPTDLEKGSCYHALGHLYMYITGGDINKAIGLCDKDKYTRDFQSVCYDGAFMQIYQPLEAEDYALIKGREVSKDGVRKFCGAFEGVTAASCYSESWPLFFEEIVTPEGVKSFCAMSPKGFETSCYTDIFYILPIQFRFDTDFMADFCKKVPGQSALCFSSMATRILEIDKSNSKKAVDFCSKAEGDSRELCYNELVKVSDFVFHKDSIELENLCEALPEDYKKLCLEKN
jgi:hypothetical protein